MTILAIFNQKGGVGKTTTALNLAAAMAHNGMEPLLIDLDPQAHLTAICGVTVPSEESIYSFYKDNRPLTELVKPLPNGINLIPSHVELSKVDTLYRKTGGVIMRLRHALYDEMLAGAGVPILVDCCPFLGILSINAIAAADGMIIPIAAEYLAMKGATQLENTLEAMSRLADKRIPRRFVVTRFVPNRRLSAHIIAEMQERYGVELCKTRIHENSAITESAGYNQDIFSFSPKSKGAKDYGFLLDELVECGFIQSVKR
ncbi:ParA family protein [Chitinivorax sp. B]|uniref:ParA family protein n=1 Tax=Chitinivorax sp. B TaxID=2502235 RepID=UPI0010F8C4F1|nr:ParA family protein [Chitinivorax sp. B]